MIGVAAEFWRGRDYFLDKRIRDKAMRDAAVPADPVPPPRAEIARAAVPADDAR